MRIYPITLIVAGVVIVNIFSKTAFNNRIKVPLQAG